MRVQNVSGGCAGRGTTSGGSEVLLLFTRFPQAGRSKTRLIPSLGAEAAAQLQREMTEHVLARVWPLTLRRNLRLEVRFAGGSVGAMRRWLGGGLDFLPQREGDLGQRLQHAIGRSFASGAKSVVVIGADCPGVDDQLVERAFEALRDHSLVFGPAKDGGYYLVGLRSPMPQLFEGVAWGAGSVLETSIAIGRASETEPVLLPELSDVDEPADLEVWHETSCASRSVSVIIPTLNEARHLETTLKQVVTDPLEVIVADGGSRDETVHIASAYGATVVKSPTGRARQMNAGAAVASGEVLLFLHADTQLPGGYRDAVLAVLRQPEILGGAFGFQIRDAFPGRWLVELTANLRSRMWQMPYGDQALFVRRWVFEHLGGFPDLPLMEDYEFVRRLRRLGRVTLLDPPVRTSGRRWLQLGFLRATLINKLIILGYRCGVAPGRLARLYRGTRSVSEQEWQRSIATRTIVQ